MNYLDFLDDHFKKDEKAAEEPEFQIDAGQTLNKVAASH